MIFKKDTNDVAKKEELSYLIGILGHSNFTIKDDINILKKLDTNSSFLQIVSNYLHLQLKDFQRTTKLWQNLLIKVMKVRFIKSK